MDIASIYAAIGPAGVALVLVACAVLYFVVSTLLYLHLVWRDFRHSFADSEKQDGQYLLAVCAQSDNPLVCIIRDIVNTHGGHSEDIRAEVAWLFHRNFERVMRSLCYLRLFAVVSPLLGLLGTIFGMVNVFQTIAASTVPDAAMLAMGIREALLTTIMGLCVAIPALMFYYFLMLKFKGFRLEAVEHSYRALELCTGTRRGGVHMGKGHV